MADGERILRLYLLDDRSVDLDRVDRLIDRLAAVCAVRGDAPD